MHTSLTSYSRIYFTNVSDQHYLADLCQELGFEQEDDNTFDLVHDEGTELTVDHALRVAMCKDNDLRAGLSIESMVACVRKILVARKITPVSTLFHDDGKPFFHDGETNVPADDRAIGDDELFDILVALGRGYSVMGIFTQWAVTSDKNSFGANYGGTNITTKDFSIPCSVQACDAEDTIKQLWANTCKNAGNYFAQRFVAPVIQSPSIVNKALSMSVQAALAQSFADIFGGNINEPKTSDPVQTAIDKINDAFLAVALNKVKDHAIEVPEIKGVRLKDSFSQ